MKERGETYFAPAERAGKTEFKKQIEIVSNNPVINGVMSAVSGLLAVLNEQRQILAVNDSLLKMLGIENIKDILGLRYGEVINCIHSHEPPHGCGTTEYCSSCGAAIAMVSSLSTNAPVERKCAIVTEREGGKEDLFLRVRSCPIIFDKKRFLLLFIQDITNQQKSEALERIFYHDVTNLITGLIGAAELLNIKKNEDTHNIAGRILGLSVRLSKEIELQKFLSHTESLSYNPMVTQILVQNIFNEIRNMFSNHLAAKNKHLFICDVPSELSIKADYSLMLRVLGNMVSNAFEASKEGDEVRILLEHNDNTITFLVWNKQTIPENISKRIFQRNFSTKPESGRGLGTYSMKLLGEGLLGGKVDFSSSESQGTVFRFSLPV